MLASTVPVEPAAGTVRSQWGNTIIKATAMTQADRSAPLAVYEVPCLWTAGSCNLDKCFLYFKLYGLMLSLQLSFAVVRSSFEVRAGMDW